MKLAEALLIRADLQTKLNQLEVRLSNNATVQEGEVPPENPHALLEQYDQMVTELETLMGKVNLTNARVEKDGVTITELLAKRDCLKMRLSTYRSFLINASRLVQRNRPTEIKVKSTVEVGAIQKIIDDTSAQLRKLEISIQELNWLTELSD